MIGAVAKPARSAHRAGHTPRNGEWLGALLVMVFPIMGNFFAPETYFSAQDFSIEAMQQAEPGFPFGRLGYMLVGLWLACLFLRMPRLFMVAIRRAALPLAFMGWALATALWSPDPAASANRSIRILLLGLFLAYLVERFPPRDIVRLVVISGAVSILASVFAVLTIPDYALSSISGYQGAWRGSTPHKNILGFLMAIVFAFASFSLTTRGSRSLGIAALIGTIALAVLSQSATALLCLVLIVTLMALLHILSQLPTRPEKILMSLAALFSTSLVAAIVFTETALLPSIGRDTTLTGRTDIWSAVYALIEERPIWGYASGFWSISSPEREEFWQRLGWAPPHAHNNILDVWFQLGIPGLVLLAAMILSAGLRSRQLLRRAAPAISRLWPILIMTVLFAGLSETNMVAASNGGLVWFTLAYLSLGKAVRTVAQASRAAKEPKRVSLPQHRAREVAAG